MVPTRRSILIESQPIKDLQSPLEERKIRKTARKGVSRKHGCQISAYSEDTSKQDKFSTMKECIRADVVALADENILLQTETMIEEQPERFCDLEGNLKYDKIDVSIDGQVLFGREKEFEKLANSLKVSMEAGSSSSIYISGPPGSGKTATVTEVLKTLVNCYKNIRTAFVNCVICNNENDVFREIYKQLTKSKKIIALSRLKNEIEKIFTTTSSQIVVVLDEIDGVKTKNNLFHYYVFQWPAIYAMVSLIGIANSLDLTVRVLPKLKLLQVPQILTFAPYGKNVLVTIIKEKLASENLNSQAVELCSRKVAAMTGDVRTAIQIARQMLSKFELEETNKNNCSTPTVLAQATSTVSEICASVTKKARLPFQQKLLLATILHLSEMLTSTTIEKGILQHSYIKVCSILSLPSLDRDAMHSALSLLEAQMLIECKSANCRLLVDSSSIYDIIEDNLLISRINKISKNELLGL